ncbi:MAG: Rieske 2Fe-2S domain-containing protein [Proteobacteria bacterium]|nr:Rieske 2Fe-2S domain-containing protein [Pseudomonadota bacterium]
MFEQEKEHIFRKGLLFAGRVKQLLNEGDFFVRSVPIFDMPLIFVRGPDGQVRGFHNACRHRGNHVCLASQGNCKYFTCSFHGWSYDTQGKLKGSTDEESFFEIERDNLGLIPVATEVWEGFIFFCLAPEPRHSLAQYLGGLGEAIAGYPFGRGTTRGISFAPDGQTMLVGAAVQDPKIAAITRPGQGSILRVAPSGVVADKPFVTGLHEPGAMAFAPPGFGEFAGDLFISDAGSWDNDIAVTSPIASDGKLYRVTQSGNLEPFASGFANPVAVSFVGKTLVLTDINGDFHVGQHKIPIGFIITIRPSIEP